MCRIQESKKISQSKDVRPLLLPRSSSWPSGWRGWLAVHAMCVVLCMCAMCVVLYHAHVYHVCMYVQMHNRGWPKILAQCAAKVKNYFVSPQNLHNLSRFPKMWRLCGDFVNWAILAIFRRFFRYNWS